LNSLSPVRGSQHILTVTQGSQPRLGLNSDAAPQLVECSHLMSSAAIESARLFWGLRCATIIGYSLALVSQLCKSLGESYLPPFEIPH